MAQSSSLRLYVPVQGLHVSGGLPQQHLRHGAQRGKAVLGPTLGLQGLVDLKSYRRHRSQRLQHCLVVVGEGNTPHCFLLAIDVRPRPDLVDDLQHPQDVLVLHGLLLARLESAVAVAVALLDLLLVACKDRHAQDRHGAVSCELIHLVVPAVILSRVPHPHRTPRRHGRTRQAREQGDGDLLSGLEHGPEHELVAFLRLDKQRTPVARDRLLCVKAQAGHQLQHTVGASSLGVELGSHEVHHVMQHGVPLCQALVRGVRHGMLPRRHDGSLALPGDRYQLIHLCVLQACLLHHHRRPFRYVVIKGGAATR
mmetsp:Transcript_151975/g.487868  ORF Transcript_151975/g.487868 Transcript_151975/m.487868 type:complete len:311 (+) Transcript_151975:2122-3054(+)